MRHVILMSAAIVFVVAALCVLVQLAVVVTSLVTGKMAAAGAAGVFLFAALITCAAVREIIIDFDG